MELDIRHNRPSQDACERMKSATWSDPCHVGIDTEGNGERAGDNKVRSAPCLYQIAFTGSGGVLPLFWGRSPPSISSDIVLISTSIDVRSRHLDIVFLISIPNYPPDWFMVTPNPLLPPNDPNAWFVIPNHWFVSRGVSY